MLQPFEPFHLRYIPRLLELGRPYLVSQTYFRAGKDATDPFGSRINLLFSDYAERGEAKLHVNAVKTDRYAAIIDLKNPAHLKKIREMLLQGSGYRIFLAVIRSAADLEGQVNKLYRDKLKKYIDSQTNWRLSKDNVVKPNIQLSFGEIFIILKHGNQHLRIKFSDIEEI